MQLYTREKKGICLVGQRKGGTDVKMTELQVIFLLLKRVVCLFGDNLIVT